MIEYHCYGGEEFTDEHEAAYHHSLEQEFNEILQYSGFVSIKWTIIMLMQDWKMKINYKMFCFLKELEIKSC